VVVLWAVLAIALAGVGVLSVAVLALVRRAQALARATRGLQDELQPILDELQRGSTEATERLEKLQRRTGERKAGARLRR
jgi:hypothetical protein